MDLLQPRPTSGRPRQPRIGMLALAGMLSLLFSACPAEEKDNNPFDENQPSFCDLNPDFFPTCTDVPPDMPDMGNEDGLDVTTVDPDTPDGEGDVEDADADPGAGDADVPDGDVPDGDVPDGDVPDGDVPDGDVPDGDVPDVDEPDDDVPDAEPTGCAFDNPPCGRGEQCNVQANECEPIPPGCAFANPPCRQGEVCDEVNNVCVGCLVDDDCAGLERCDVEANTCVGCFGDDDCPGLSICDVETNTCGERQVDDGPSLCTSAEDCEEGRVCTPDGCADQQVECGFGDAVCPLDEFCVRGECEGFECLNDDDCSGSRRCSDGGFCVDCLEDADCPGACESNFCVECRDDDNCPGAQICLIPGNLCQEGGQGQCASDDDCLGERVCQIGQCVGDACARDPFEPNDTPADARELQEGVTELRSCGEPEWFKIPMQAGDGMLLQIDYEPGALLDVDLQAPPEEGLEQGNLLDRFPDPALIGQIQVVLEEALVTGDYQVSIEVAQAPEMDYTVTLLRVPGGFCVNDNFEPSNTPEAGAVLNPEAFFGTVARICEGDEDWFQVELEAGFTYRAALNSFEQPLFVEVFGPDASTRLARNASPELIKELDFVAEESGIHFVRLEALNDDLRSVYELRVFAP